MELVAALGAAIRQHPEALQQLAGHFRHERDTQVLVQIGRFCAAKDLP
jgi:hypothetical protein